MAVHVAVHVAVYVAVHLAVHVAVLVAVHQRSSILCISYACVTWLHDRMSYKTLQQY